MIVITIVLQIRIIQNDSYSYAKSTDQFQRGKLGDGTKEFGPFYSVNYGNIDRQIGSWYSDGAFFVSEQYPWFRYGGSYVDGADAGITTFSCRDGKEDNMASFRIVLTF